jgi:CDP-diacylglycerol--serine O-phosphatidyltransferase
MKRIGVLPALVTLGNGYCGLLAVYKVSDGELFTASWLILLAMVFDVLDGKIARIAGITSQFGAYLDSLCDAISFGVAPAFLAKEAAAANVHPKLVTLCCSLFALCAILRLARYNVEHAASEGNDREGGEVTSFAGLPTPGAAGVIAALGFFAYDERPVFDPSLVRAALPFLCPFLGFLMVSRMPFVHFGNRFLRGRRDFSYFFWVVVLAVLVTRFPQETCAVAFVLYALSGPALLPFRPKEQEVEEPSEPAEAP